MFDAAMGGGVDVEKRVEMLMVIGAVSIDWPRWMGLEVHRVMKLDGEMIVPEAVEGKETREMVAV
jgi:hypothetical protein